jgi:hypothetical protein
MKSFAVSVFFLLVCPSFVFAQKVIYQKIDESVAVDNGGNGGVGW